MDISVIFRLGKGDVKVREFVIVFLLALPGRAKQKSFTLTIPSLLILKIFPKIAASIWSKIRDLLLECDSNCGCD